MDQAHSHPGKGEHQPCDLRVPGVIIFPDYDPHQRIHPGAACGEGLRNKEMVGCQSCSRDDHSRSDAQGRLFGVKHSHKANPQSCQREEEIDIRLKEAVKGYERDCRIEMGNFRSEQEEYYSRKVREKIAELEKKALIKNACTAIICVAASISLFFALKYVFYALFMF